MPYIHEPVALPQLERITTDKGRVYVTPGGNKYPSITTVLEVLSRRDIQNWRKRIGSEEANSISARAANRGTNLHTIIEHYLQNETVTPTIHFNIIKSELSRIGKIYAQEKSLWSDKYRVAGTTDCIAEFDGVLSVIDFKTAKGFKRKEWIEHYFIQATFYAEAWEELTGTPISNLVIMMAGDDGSKMVYTDDKEPYLDKLITVIDLFNNEVR
jgi:genome maintenance exonuclease 1